MNQMDHYNEKANTDQTKLDSIKHELEDQGRYMLGDLFKKSEAKLLGQNASLDDLYERYLNDCTMQTMSRMKSMMKEPDAAGLLSDARETLAQLKNADSAEDNAASKPVTLTRSLKQYEKVCRNLERVKSRNGAGVKNMNCEEMAVLGMAYDSIVAQADAYLEAYGGSNMSGNAGEKDRIDTVESLLAHYKEKQQWMNESVVRNSLRNCKMEVMQASGEVRKDPHSWEKNIDLQIKKEMQINVKVLATLQGKGSLSEKDQEIARDSMLNLLACSWAKRDMTGDTISALSLRNVEERKTIVYGGTEFRFSARAIRSHFNDLLTAQVPEAAEITIGSIREVLSRTGDMPEAFKKMERAAQ